jgi:hypothetical protein
VYLVWCPFFFASTHNFKLEHTRKKTYFYSNYELLNNNNIIMTNYKISLALMAMTMYADAFTVSPVAARSSALLSTSTTNDVFFMDETKPEPPTVAMTESIQPAQPISPKKSVAPPKKAASHGSTGVLAPVVKTVKSVIGEEELNKLRGKVIAMHSDIIKSFVDTSDSPLGQTVLRTMFDVADVLDKNGTVDEIELGKALKTLGFRF